MIKKVFVLSITLGLLFSGVAWGQEEVRTTVTEEEVQMPIFQSLPPQIEKSPQQIQTEMNMAMESMGPAMGNMMEQMMDGMFNYLAKKETAMKMARFTRNYYVALVKAGFTKEEALQIVINAQMPSLGQ